MIVLMCCLTSLDLFHALGKNPFDPEFADRPETASADTQAHKTVLSWNPDSLPLQVRFRSAARLVIRMRDAVPA
jgi:hypothetical protein